MDDITNLAQWRVNLRRVIFNLRWTLFRRHPKDVYHCLTCRMPATYDGIDDAPNVSLREILRRPLR